MLGVWTICDKLNDMHKELKEINRKTGYISDVRNELNRLATTLDNIERNLYKRF